MGPPAFTIHSDLTIHLGVVYGTPSLRRSPARAGLLYTGRSRPESCPGAFDFVIGLVDGLLCAAKSIFTVLIRSPAPVSYTHLDVYKRQSWFWAYLLFLLAAALAMQVTPISLVSERMRRLQPKSNSWQLFCHPQLSAAGPGVFRDFFFCGQDGLAAVSYTHLRRSR